MTKYLKYSGNLVKAKKYKTVYRDRYNPYEPDHIRVDWAPTKKWIRDNWHEITGTDQYRVVKIEEVK